MTKFKSHSQSFCRTCYAHKIGKGEPCKKHSPPVIVKTKESCQLKHSDVCKNQKQDSKKLDSVCEKHSNMSPITPKPCQHKTSSKTEHDFNPTKPSSQTKSPQLTSPIEIDDIQLNLQTQSNSIRAEHERPLCPGLPPFHPPPFCPHPQPPHPQPPYPQPPYPNPIISTLQQQNEQLKQQLILLQQQNDNLADQCQQNFQNSIDQMNSQAQFELELQAQQQRELNLLSQINNQRQTEFLGASTTPSNILYEQLQVRNVTELASVGDLVKSIQVCSSQVSNNTSPNPNAEQGYWTLDLNGNVKAYGNAKCYGSLSSHPNWAGQRKSSKPIGMTIHPTKQGYWIGTENGEVYAFGDAQFFGSASSYRLSKPIVGIHATETGNGYWLVSSNGGIMGFGDASFQGSESSTFLETQKPIIGVFS